ncbi:MAG TPA: hypothetical protein VFR24_16955 [Candidatus Angelobacter sp.]|nr:hypothetical protein [Candidatus Angelobacter sp.]
MDSQSIKEVFKELYSHLERLETQNTAILLFLKEKNQVTDKQLAPYLEQAGNAANVKWRAERVRMEYLLTQTDALTGSSEETENQSSASPEIERNISDKEEPEQATVASGEGQPEDQEHQDFSRPAEAQVESAPESGDEKEEGDEKVA